ncbi:MAG: Rrf2 family transcriptional regulator [Polyangiales bacterium]
MQLSQFTDYGLRTLIYLAVAPDQAATMAEISEAYGISSHHGAKVATALAHNGWVAARRGRNGGLRLAKDPADIRIGAVVRTLESMDRMVECAMPGESECAILPACDLRHMIMEAQECFLRCLDQYTLADASRPKDDLVQLLQIRLPAP